MANDNPPERPSPWQPVYGGSADREPVAPSKPALPTTGAIPVVPEPIEDGDADVVSPVDSPPDEEIMPTSRGPLWTADPPAPASDQPATSDDPVRALGDSAVRSASLSASGAPTPMAGVPRPSAASAATGASAASAPRTAWFAGDPRLDAPQGAAEWSAGTPDEDPPAYAPVPAIDIPDFADDEEPAYTPPFGVAMAAAGAAAARGAGGEQSTHDPGSGDENATPSTQGDDDGSSGKPPTRERTPWYGSAPFLILIGLLVMGGIGYGVYLLLQPEPETVELTQPVLVDAAATPTLDPITIEDPTSFQAAMPGTVGAYALTGVTAVPPQSAGLEVRAAEVNDLTYSDGTTTLSLRAIQHYDEEDATEQFDALAADATERDPVEAGGSEVGERALLSGEAGDQIVWRNATAVFVVTGPAEEIADLYALFPL